jgi:GNAT superfamily N-acetyltransferase
MFIRRDFRGQGITRQLIKAAVDQARAHGAKIVEAYPVDPDSPSYRFMGFVPTFEKAGFKPTGQREGKRRHLMQLELTS